MTVLVVIPTYNERENLPVVVPAVLVHGYGVLIVDDHSPDGTGAIADELSRQHPGRVEVLHRTGPRGLGRSYIDGLTRALAADADVICQMDADLSHDPKSVPSLVAATEQADLVIGSRYLDGVSVVNWPFHRIILSAFANRYVRVVTGMPVHDCTSGFRCWRRTALAAVPLAHVRSEGYAFLVETLGEAVGAGLRVQEVPIVFVERRQGQSKLDLGVLSESLITPWRIRWRQATRSRG